MISKIQKIQLDHEGKKSFSLLRVQATVPKYEGQEGVPTHLSEVKINIINSIFGCSSNFSFVLFAFSFNFNLSIFRNIDLNMSRTQIRPVK
jgi:hypothetical protein